MTTMKRTQDINHGNFRKKNPVFYLAPVALAVGAVFMLYGRSSNAEDVDASIYRNAQECIAANPTLVDTCNASHASAILEAQQTAPKYASKADCEAEFGVGSCEVAQAGNAETAQVANSEPRQGSMWMPLMMGYMMGRMSGGAYAHSPMFSSTSARSPAHNKFVDATGRTFGNSTTANRNMKVDRSAFAPKPATTQTITRGGFGQSVAKMNTAQSSASKSTARTSSSSSSAVRTFGG